MSDISQPASLPMVQRRLEGRSQGGGNPNPNGPPAKKVAETYQQIDRTKPVDDRITILGIPADQITPPTQAALASLVAENNFLRSAVKRLEKIAQADSHAALGDATAALTDALAAPAAPTETRVIVYAYLNTFDDVRRSSGLLAAKSLLADLSFRFSTAKAAVSLVQGTPPESFAMVASGIIGGAAVAGVMSFPTSNFEDTVVARQVRDAVTAEGFNVGGIDMAISLTVGATRVSRGEGFLTALGRVDHLIRGSN